ncbi:MAG: Diguanylate cyclase [Deltaproteobacteria bacterium]|nr:Diguanylate cyclase [Deltaproteobacteria bacterium]
MSIQKLLRRLRKMTNNGPKVLIVDDDSLIRTAVMEMLTNWGYEGIEASSGKEALHRALVDKPDLILLDLIMPDISGFAVCKTLRTEMNVLATPIIILTARGEKDDILKCFELGANDYIVKPVEPFELEARIKTQLHIKGLYDGASAEKEDLAMLLKISTAVSSTLNSRDILYTIVKCVGEAIDVDRCSIVRIGSKKGVAYVVTTYDNPGINNLAIDLSKYPEIRSVLEVKGTVIIEDIQNDPRMASVKDILKELGFSSLLIIPIIVREEIVGTLVLRTSRKKTSFSPREVKLCQVIVNLAASALTNAHLFESVELSNLELEKLAITDGLTGAYNHRHFRTRLDEELNRAIRYGTPLSCIMMDIDHFKHINDAFGHAQGDKVLSEITDVIKNNVRHIDIVARYGGEEFVVLLPNTDKEGAFIEAERLRKAVNAYRCSSRDRSIVVTISLGVATFPSPEISSADELVGKADNALYEAKRNGRNNTVEA